MQNLPTGYDNDYVSSQNMMSVSGRQITQQQWSIVFAGVSERSRGGLGVVSRLLPNMRGTTSPSRFLLNSVANSMSTMAFSSNQAFVFRNVGTTVVQVPFSETIVSVARTYWILHTQGGNLYPDKGHVRALYDAQDWNGNYLNRGTLNDFRR